MPNYCSNSVTITATSDVLEAINDACQKGEFFKFIQHYDEWDYGSFVETYGTKWEPSIIDVSIDVDTQSIHIIMDTAWSPPIEAYNLLMERDDVESVEAYYSEPGMDYCGRYIDGYDESIEMTPLAEKIMAEEALTDFEQEMYESFEGEIESIIEWRQEEEE